MNTVFSWPRNAISDLKVMWYSKLVLPFQLGMLTALFLSWGWCTANWVYWSQIYYNKQQPHFNTNMQNNHHQGRNTHIVDTTETAGLWRIPASSSSPKVIGVDLFHTWRSLYIYTGCISTLPCTQSGIQPQRLWWVLLKTRHSSGRGRQRETDS